MAVSPQSAWAVDIGNNSLKALRLQAAGDEVEVIGLDYIEHSKILSEADITEEERAAIISNTLQTFAQRNNIGHEEVAISVPGQSSFARFVKLPPVEPKRIPEIVQFEAVQQIPFDINEVECDWQVMEKPDSPDTEVGIFAIKNELIANYLENFSNEHIKINIVQMAPIALYNYVHYDRVDLGTDSDKVIIVLDMGAENTDLIACTKSSVWQRCIPLGGNAFTNAIAEAFKLKFAKAEKLKRGAVMSKYARQIFHAMRPVFTDFAAEIQRSLGYYSNANKGVTFSKIIVLGGGFKLQGLVKYLGQTLQMQVVRPDSFEKLTAGADISSAKLHENISDLGVVYGLGLQAIGKAKIESNLLPSRMAKAMAWAEKSRYFTIAAGMLLILSFMSLAKTTFDNKAYFSNDAKSNRSSIERVIQQTNKAKQQLSAEEKRDSGYEQIIAKYTDVFKYRSVIPLLYETITACLPNAKNNPEQKEVYEAFGQKDIARLLKTPRNQRKQIFVTRLSIDYAESLAMANLDSGTGRSRRRTATSRSTTESPEMGFGGMPGGGMPGGFPPITGGYSPKKGPPKKRFTEKDPKEPAELEDGAGFIIIIEGYGPYEKIDELLDPAFVEQNQSEWGVVTRLANLDKLAADGNSPFKLFTKEFEHFRLDTGEVEINANDMPEGIGIKEEKLRGPIEEKSNTISKDRANRQGASAKSGAKNSDRIISEKVLLDPMTKEEISKTFDLDEIGEKKYDDLGKPTYIVRDHWFRIKAKILWKNAPKEDKEKNKKKKIFGE